MQLRHSAPSEAAFTLGLTRWCFQSSCMTYASYSPFYNVPSALLKTARCRKWKLLLCAFQC